MKLLRCEECGTDENVHKRKHLYFAGKVSGHVTLGDYTPFCDSCANKIAEEHSKLFERTIDTYIDKKRKEQ